MHQEVKVTDRSVTRLGIPAEGIYSIPSFEDRVRLPQRVTHQKEEYKDYPIISNVVKWALLSTYAMISSQTKCIGPFGSVVSLSEDLQ